MTQTGERMVIVCTLLPEAGRYTVYGGWSVTTVLGGESFFLLGQVDLIPCWLKARVQQGS